MSSKVSINSMSLIAFRIEIYCVILWYATADKKKLLLTCGVV